MNGDSKKTLQEAMAAAAKEALNNQASDLLYGVREGEGPLAPWPTQPCKIVFLDFDGVLNSEATNQAMGTRYKFSPDSIKALNEILLRSRGYIVITSTWRDNWSLRENALFLRRSGVMPICVLGKTPTLKDTRGREIETWLKEVPFPVDSFAILDDRTDMEPYQPRLVLIDPLLGLDEKHIEQTLQILSLSWRR